VYATKKQAQFAFSRIATIGAARCFAKEAKGDDVTVVSVGTRTFVRVGETTCAFRIALSSSNGSWYDDLVYVRRGRTLLRIGFVAEVDVTSLETTLARAVAARGR
jgi:hypothetical protein